jgi:PadR family transcriptional regulator PadR
MTMSVESPLGSFEEQVMVAVVRTGEAAWGTSVRREIESVTGRDLAIGAVYATLDRLEAKGYVRSRRETVDGASRRVFSLARAGARALMETRAMRERLWRGVSLQTLTGLVGDLTRG